MRIFVIFIFAAWEMAWECLKGSRAQKLKNGRNEGGVWLESRPLLNNFNKILFFGIFGDLNGIRLINQKIARERDGWIHLTKYKSLDSEFNPLSSPLFYLESSQIEILEKFASLLGPLWTLEETQILILKQVWIVWSFLMSW